ncbi:1-acyl-sn-glycerol-3-phosphate acyltransferase [Moraxella cuniculi DSM 21768]|uniref:1-acyl-sn-glycerol-3-phosphate acyltransferase n=1 Tax=Moraxella cuniculi DSM 21768 TaxID=1122245 RepID=A0A1N7EDU4_9GAMM|nr:acyltransferase [Moraxella cuniculi]OOS05314.1 acyltransferase [Moraxella cuniculi]SIR86257.1 1-acyl-sn-glycerol-3-phosphate acyltransferase [Moraxella cuniculi DSM 21768]
MSNGRKTLPFFAKLHQKQPKLAQKLSLITSTSTIAANSLLVGVPVIGAGVTKMLTGSKRADDTVIGITNHWLQTNNLLIDKVLPSKDWRINLPDNLDPNGRYLLICNHQSWVDTSIIQYISEGVLPITRFFTKHELIYIPIVGQTFYFLDFPMMKRHSKEQIAKNPALANRDLQEARRACNLLSGKPFVLLNYLEGTRFTAEKHAKQNSPYRHLLKPKAGGLALALASLGQQIDGILDMTLVYPDGVPTYADLWSGKLRRLAVDIEFIRPNDALLEALKNGKYESDDTVKAQMYAWLDELWQAKDAKIDALLNDFDPKNNPSK